MERLFAGFGDDVDAREPEEAAHNGGVMETLHPGVRHFLRMEFVQCLEEPVHVDFLQQAAEGTRQQTRGNGGLPVNQDGALFRQDEDVAQVVQIEVDHAMAMHFQNAFVEPLEIVDGKNAAPARGIGRVLQQGAERFAGAEIFLQTERGEACDVSRHDADVREPPQVADFAPDQEAADGVADRPGGFRKIFFDDGGIAGAVNPVNPCVEDAAAVNQDAFRADGWMGGTGLSGG